MDSAQDSDLAHLFENGMENLFLRLSHLQIFQIQFDFGKPGLTPQYCFVTCLTPNVTWKVKKNSEENIFVFECAIFS